MRGVDIALLVDAEVVVAGVVGFIQLSSIHFMGWLFYISPQLLQCSLRQIPLPDHHQQFELLCFCFVNEKIYDIDTKTSCETSCFHRSRYCTYGLAFQDICFVDFFNKKIYC